MSIVLVILGLLVGGVLAGQSLIRAAELRSISTDFAKFDTALNAFRDKYFAIPGDMNNATSYWGKSATYCNGEAGSAATPGTCNGNNNSKLEWESATSAYESRIAWQHMALAGLIEGNYTGRAGSVSQLGVTIPRGRIGDTGYNFYAATLDGSSAIADRNRIVYGTPTAGSSTTDPALKPEEGYNVDMKIDDGKPRLGRLIGAGNGVNPCYSGAEYNLSHTNVGCYFTYIPSAN